VSQDPAHQAETPAANHTRSIAIALVVALAAGGLAYSLGALGPAPLDPNPEAPDTTAVISLDTLPEALRLTPQAVDGAVRLAAEGLPRDAGGVLDAVRNARTKGKLPAREVDGALDGAPRSAGDLAVALTGQTAPASGTLEQALLLGALLDARGLGPVAYGVDDAAPDTATDIVGRRYLVKAGEGAWLALDEAPVPDSVRALSEAGLLANILAWRAHGALADEEIDAASKASQTARSLAQKDAAILFVAGQVQVLGGLAEPGLATMERAAGIRADSHTWFALGVMAAEANQPFKARQYLLKAAEGSREAEPHLLLAQLALDRLPTTPKDGHARLMEEAQGHVARAEVANARVDGLTTMKAQLAALSGDLEGAEALLRADTAARPKEAAGWLALFQYLMETRREREAMEVVQEGIDAGAEGAGLHHVLGVMQASDGQASGAIASMKRALEIEPDRRGGLRLQLAQLVREAGDEAKAMALLREEIGLKGGEQRQARLLLAQIHLDNHNPSAAKPLVDEVLVKDPSDQEARMIAYLTALEAGRGVDAEKKAAIEAVGKRSTVAQVLMEQGRVVEGEKLLREAVVEEPNDPLGPVLLGAVLVGTGRVEEATTLREEVLARTPVGDERDQLRQLFDTAYQQARQAVESQEGEESGQGGDGVP